MGNTFAKALAWDLTQEGFKVDVPQMTFEDPQDYGKHEIDLVIELGGRDYNIEVKSRDLILTPDQRLFYWSEYKGDFAEGQGILIDEVDDWERKQHDVLVVVVVSQITEKRLFVPVETKDSWKMTDRGYGASYEVPVELALSWSEGIKWLKTFNA